MANPIQIGALLTQGLRSEFALVYQPRYQGVLREIGDVIWLEATSDKVREIYGFLEAAPYPERWPIGSVIPSKNMLSQQFNVVNRDYAMRIYLPRNYEDDQTGTAMMMARNIGRNWATLAERIFYQYVQNGTDADLLPAVPNSADGNALYLSTTRYGSANGNIVTQTGSATVQQIITDLFSVGRRFIEFQNTESQPFWDPADVRRIKVFHGSSLTLVMQQAAHQMRPIGSLAGVDTTDPRVGAAVTNILQEGEYRFSFVNSQRITNASLYCFLQGIPNDVRPIVRQVRKTQVEAVGNYATSDHVRDTGEAYVQFDSREGWGSALAISTIRVS